MPLCAVFVQVCVFLEAWRPKVLPGVCEGNGGNNAPTDVFTKLCGLENAGGVS